MKKRWDLCMISPENLTRVQNEFPCNLKLTIQIFTGNPYPLSRAQPCVLKLRRWQKTENIALLHQLAHSEVERQWPKRERDERVPKQGKEKKQRMQRLSPPTAPFLKAQNWSCYAGMRRIRLSQTRPTLQLRFPPPLCNGLPDLMNLLSTVDGFLQRVWQSHSLHAFKAVKNCQCHNPQSCQI